MDVITFGLYVVGVPIAIYAFCSLVFVLYAAVMNVRRVKHEDKLNRWITALFWPWLGLGYVLNLVHNVAVCSVLFLELPRELMTSARMWRHSQGGTGWRKRWAEKIRSKLLDPLDHTGIHRG